MTATCVRKDCRNEAELLPVVLMWAVGYRRGSHDPGRMTLGLPCCRRCSLDIGIPDLIARDQWPEIVRAFMAGGKAAPDLRTAQLEWIPLTSAEATTFIQAIPAPERGLIH